MTPRHSFRVGGRPAAAAADPDTVAALLASGVPLSTTYEMTQGSPASRYFHEHALEAGYSEVAADSWPCEAAELKTGGPVAFRQGAGDVIYETRDAVIYVSLGYGWFSVQVAAASRDRVGEVFASFRETYPASYVTQRDDTNVPITFWTYTEMGPRSRLRRIDSAEWPTIETNYTASVRDELDRVMGWQSGGDAEGQLLLWYGPPGTGKTWALRALATQWAPWAEFHFITDPDAFFVAKPSYMIDVLLADSYEALSVPDADGESELLTETGDGKWRVLILEDTGELLAASSSDTYRQGLARLLNVVDGMIGQGLRVLAIVTTNDELEDLHAAVTRPGRCASRIEFGPLTDAEAQEWTGKPDATGGTLAELYARGGRSGQEPLGDDETAETPDESSLAASGPENASEQDVVGAIAAVAEDVNPLAVDYGGTAYDTETKTVLWVAGDGTSEDEVDQVAERFLAIDGVENFEHEHEAMPSGWCGADVVYVYKASRDSYDCGDEEAAIEREVAAIVARAREPLDV